MNKASFIGGVILACSTGLLLGCKKAETAQQSAQQAVQAPSQPVVEAKGEHAQFAAAKGEIKAMLKDPESAQFADLRLTDKGAVCGRVNAKNSMGGYVGFKDFVVFEGKVNIREQVEPPDLTFIMPAYESGCGPVKAP